MIFRISGNPCNQAPSDTAINGIIFLAAVWHYTSNGLKKSIPGGMENLVSWALSKSLGVLVERGMLAIVLPDV